MLNKDKIRKVIRENPKGFTIDLNANSVKKTDGFGDNIPRKVLRKDIIWILSKNGSDELVKNYGRVIKLK